MVGFESRPCGPLGPPEVAVRHIQGLPTTQLAPILSHSVNVKSTAPSFAPVLPSTMMGFESRPCGPLGPPEPGIRHIQGLPTTQLARILSHSVNVKRTAPSSPPVFPTTVMGFKSRPCGPLGSPELGIRHNQGWAGSAHHPASYDLIAFC